MTDDTERCLRLGDDTLRRDCEKYRPYSWHSPRGPWFAALIDLPRDVDPNTQLTRRARPAKVVEAERQHMLRFLRTCCLAVGWMRVPKSIVTSRYQDWCDEVGEDPLRGNLLMAWIKIAVNPLSPHPPQPIFADVQVRYRGSSRNGLKGIALKVS